MLIGYLLALLLFGVPLAAFQFVIQALAMRGEGGLAVLLGLGFYLLLFWVIGVVGQLQLDVLVSRLEAEYKVAAGLEMAPFETARWVLADDPADLKAFADVNRAAMAKDRDGNPVFMAKTAWEVGYVAERYPKVRFMATRER